MNYITHQVKGRGRGKFLGFPTINMDITPEMEFEEGVWAAWIDIHGRSYKGALHFGPIPTFGIAKRSLEAFLLDIADSDVERLDTNHIVLRPVTRLREVKQFTSQEALVAQMQKDIALVREVLASASEVQQVAESEA